MLKKLLGLGKKMPEGTHAGELTDRTGGESPDVGPGRPWLSISWQLSDLESSKRVRRVAEALADRVRDPSTMFAEFGACDAGLVTLRVHKEAQRAGVAPLAAESERVMRRILGEADPAMHPTEYVCVACPCEDGANQQIVAMRAPDSGAMTLERIVVREGEVVVREPLALDAIPSPPTQR